MSGYFNNITSDEMNFSPKNGPCYSFIQDNNVSRKTIWLVPHVIKHKQESEVITWRCSWGNVCQAECLYASAKE